MFHQDIKMKNIYFKFRYINMRIKIILKLFFLLIIIISFCLPAFANNLNKLVLMSSGYVLNEDSFLVGIAYSRFSRDKEFEIITSSYSISNKKIDTKKKQLLNKLDFHLISLYLNYGLKKRLETDIGFTVYRGDNDTRIDYYTNSQYPAQWDLSSSTIKKNLPYSIDIKIKYNFLREGNIFPSSLIKIIVIYGRSIPYIESESDETILKTDLDMTVGFSFSKYIYYSVFHCDLGASMNDQYPASAILSLGLEGKLSQELSLFMEYNNSHFHSFAKFENENNIGIGLKYKNVQIGAGEKSIVLNYYF